MLKRQKINAWVPRCECIKITDDAYAPDDFTQKHLNPSISTCAIHKPNDDSLVILVGMWEYLQEEDDPKIAAPPTQMSMNERILSQRAIDYYEEIMRTKFSVQ